MPLKNNRAPLLCYFKLCALFHRHIWRPTRVTVRKRPIRVKIDYFLSHVTLKFDRWPWKTIGHIFYATSSFVHHFVVIDEFKLELQSGNRRVFCAVWPLILTDHIEKQKGTSFLSYQTLCIISSPYVNSPRSYNPETAKLGFDLCDLDLWPLTLTFCMDINFVIANISWNLHDETIMGT